MQQMINNYYSSMKQTMLKELRKARTDRKTIDELMGIFKGDKDVAFKNGLLNKFRNQANSMLATALQHITSVSQHQYEALFYERYRWVAVLDEVTTAICRGRDGKTWLYGKGPLPPAHYNCRSKVVPVDDSRKNLPATFFEWLQEQPNEVLSDIVGTKEATAIKSGKAKQSAYPKYVNSAKINIAAFKDKLKFILM